jgi:hypothetical protein
MVDWELTLFKHVNTCERSNTGELSIPIEWNTKSRNSFRIYLANQLSPSVAFPVI